MNQNLGRPQFRYRRLHFAIATILCSGTAIAATIGGVGSGSSSTDAVVVGTNTSITVVPASPAFAALSKTVVGASNVSAPQLPVMAAGARPFELGINVGASVYYGSERTFANLAYAAARWRDPLAGWIDTPADKLTADGYPITGGALTINVPQTVWDGTDTQVTCYWAGSGNVRIDGNARARGSNSSVTFTWPGRVGEKIPSILLYVDSISASAPFTNLDCREKGLATNGPFDQRIVNDLTPYAVLRFLDWSSANSNPASVTWDKRSLPARLVQNGTDGIALENMIDLANAAGSDAWFTVPWNADETYVRAMAKLVHDRLSSSHRAYFELSNETWNYGFKQATQALNEGLAEKLSPEKYTNNLLRYAEKSTWMHKLLTSAFADQPARLVRVVNVQNSNPWCVDQILGFRDTAQWVDAVATAPYFGHELFTGSSASEVDQSKLFAALEVSRVKTIGFASANKTAATKWKKRYITYEGGQHIIPPVGNAAATAAATQMQRSPQMYDIYRRYIGDYKATIGDTMTLFSSTGVINQYGAWGIREFANQPLSQTPKRRAALGFAR